MLPGEELRQAAQVAITARKDYGAVPKGQPLAKSHERALSEAAAARAVAVSPANSASLSEEDALPEEDDWGIESAPGPELPFSMPNGRTVYSDAKSAHASFTGGNSRLGEHLSSKDVKLQSGSWAQNHSLPRLAALQTVPRVPPLNGQEHFQGVGQSEASSDAPDNSHASRTPSSTAAQLPLQETGASLQTSDHSALPALCNHGQRQVAQGLRKFRDSHRPLAAETESQQVQQEMQLSQIMEPSNTNKMPGIEPSKQRTDHSHADASQQAGEKQSKQPYGSDRMQHGKRRLGPSGVMVSRTSEGGAVQAQNHDRHSSASSEGLRLIELQKLQALSAASKHQVPQWLDSGSDDLSADLRLAQKLQQEELRWHQLHSRADPAKRKLKKESTLDAFFKRPAR